MAAQSVAVYAFIVWASTAGALIIEGEDWLIHRRPYVRAQHNLKAIKLYRNANKTRTLDVRINPGGWNWQICSGGWFHLVWTAAPGAEIPPKSKNRSLEKIVYTSRFSDIFQNSQNCRQITATPRRSIFHAAKFLQMPYKAKNKKSRIFIIKLKIP